VFGAIKEGWYDGSLRGSGHAGPDGEIRSLRFMASRWPTCFNL